MRRIIAAAAFLSIVCASACCRAQRDDVVVEDGQQVQQGRRAVGLNAVDALGFGVAGAQVTDATIQQLVFGNARNAATGIKLLESHLRLKVDDLVRVCEASAEQKQRLELAGQADIRRFQERIEELKKEFQAAGNDPNKVNQLYQRAQQMRPSPYGSLFDEGSFFAKTVKNALAAEQLTRYEQAERERTEFQYRARVELVVAALDGALGMTEEQRRKLAALLLEQTKPPKKFGTQDFHFVVLQMSRLPEEQLKPLFDEPQWRLLTRQFAQAKAMEPTLRQNGLLTDDPAQ